MTNLVTSSELLGLIISFAYAAMLLGLGELLHRPIGVPQELTRKYVHVGAGLWVFGIMMLFYRWEVGIIPFATFIVINAALYRFRLASAVDAPDSAPGTVYFAIALTLLFALLWRPLGPTDRSPAAVAGAMALTWGDALASIVGRRLGRHHYEVGGTQRSLEGSAAMFVASFAAIALTLLLLPGSSLAPIATSMPAGQALLVALLAATVATAAEAITPRGLDNLSVPIATALVVVLLTPVF